VCTVAARADLDILAPWLTRLGRVDIHRFEFREPGNDQ
jgi:hypothetical protein